MRIEQTSINDFQTGQGPVDSAPKPVVAANWCNKAYQGVRVRALTTNNVSIFIGPESVTPETGFELPAGAEVGIPIEDASKISVVCTPEGNSSQTVTLASTAPGDTFTLTLDGETTTALSTSAADTDVQDALCALIGSGNCSVSGDAGGPYTVTFIGDWAGRDVDLMVGTGSGCNTKQSIVVTGSAAGDMVTLTWSAHTLAPVAYNAAPTVLQVAFDAAIGAGNSVVTDAEDGWLVEFTGTYARAEQAAITGAGGKNEKQSITVTGTGGTVVYSFGADSTDPLAYNVTGVDLQTALCALDSIGTGNCTVTGDGPYTVEFTGAKANTSEALIEASANGGANEKQTITLDASVTDGTFTLTWMSQITGALSYNISAEDLQSALATAWGLADAVSVTAGDPSGWVVEFIGTRAHEVETPITGDGTNLVGDVTTVTVVETVVGYAVSVAVVETQAGNLDTITITETQAANAGSTATVAQGTVASANTHYSWILA